MVKSPPANAGDAGRMPRSGRCPGEGNGTHPSLLAWEIPWTVAYQVLHPWDFPGKSAGVDLPFPFPGDLPNPGIDPRSPALQEDALPSEPPGKPLVW